MLGTTRSGLALVDEVGPAEASTGRSSRAARRREPLAYVLGEWGFRGLTLKVDRRVLVPRPETEVVVERCLALLDGVAAGSSTSASGRARSRWRSPTSIRERA